MTRHIDHLVLPVRDLNAAAAFYRRLGFQVGARNHHPWGTDNFLVQFSSSFLELITVAEPAMIPPHAPRTFSFGAFVRDYLERREGLAMFVLDSDDAQTDAQAYADAGIGDYKYFTFKRSGRAADGTETHLAFSLAFATDKGLPEAAFFTCQQHYPEAFWSPQLQRHDNGASNISAAFLQVEHPEDHTGFLRTFTGVGPERDGLRYDLGRGGRLQLTRGNRNRFTGFAVGVPDVDAAAARLTAEDIPFERTDRGVAIPPDAAFGATICFEVAR